MSLKMHLNFTFRAFYGKGRYNLVVLIKFVRGVGGTHVRTRPIKTGDL